MPTHCFDLPRGEIVHVNIDSVALGGNLIGDPGSRSVAVYLPQGYRDCDTDYPLLVGLAPFTGSGLKMLSWQSFGESVPQRLDRLVAEERMGPVVAAFPDGFTSLGGNQYVNTPVLGDWETFLLDEMIPALEAGFRIRRGPRHRAVFGRSSGGYGALVQGLLHGDRWAAVACHSGDIDFDLVYRRDLPGMLDVLARHEDGVQGFLAHLRRAEKIRGPEMHTLMLLAMAASYDPDASAPKGIRLPVDSVTCGLIEDRWNNWLAHDPLRMIERPECVRSLSRLSGLFLDCGSRDPYFLHFGARALARKLREHGIEHRHEEFDDTHSGIDYRLDVSLPYLYRALG